MMKIYKMSNITFMVSTRTKPTLKYAWMLTIATRHIILEILLYSAKFAKRIHL